MVYDAARLATGVLGVLMLVGVLAFIVIYWTKARWRDSTLGRHMLYFMVALALVLIVRTLRYFWPDAEWLVYLGLLTFAMLVLVVWQRVWLLVRSLREVG